MLPAFGAAHLGGGSGGDKVVAVMGRCWDCPLPSREEPELCCVTGMGLCAEVMAMLCWELGHTGLSEGAVCPRGDVPFWSWQYTICSP